MNPNFYGKSLVIVFLLMIQNIYSADSELIKKNVCNEQGVTVKTEFKTKNRYFFFRKTNHKKVKRIDKAVDENGRILVKTVMRSTEKGDVYDFRKFHRLVIDKDEIHEVICLLGEEIGKLIIYDFCGEKISEQNVNTEDLLEKYRF
ncbi:hypothetical protein ACFFLS_11525 [Flavobacterium procerum]|uniref:Uncharacterized protein n=1 Tax=Flavobacterium procerum TaxID=1455569 RepID=A0ABV6BSR1_9FLAO